MDQTDRIVEPTESRQAWNWITMLSAMVSFLFSFYIQQACAARGSHRFVDILFDIDMALMLNPHHLLASYRHPLLPALYNIPPTIFGFPLIYGLGMSPAGARELVLTLEAALFCAISSILLIQIIRAFGGSMATAGFVAAVDLLSPCHVFMGSILDSFVITSMCLRLCLWLCAIQFDLRGRRNQWIMLGVGVLSIGTTLTNAVWWSICFVYLSLRSGLSHWKQVGVSLAVSGILATGFSFLALPVAAPFIGVQVRDVAGAVIYSLTDGRRFERKPDLERFVQIEKAFIHAFIAAEPSLKPILTVDAPTLNRQTFKALMVSYEGHQSPPLRRVWNTVLLVGTFAAGAVGLWKSGGVLRFMLLGSAGWLVFNLLLHGFWGSDDLFLYSLHWQSLTVFWLVGLPALFEQRKVVAWGLFLLLVSYQMSTTLPSVGSVLDQLETANRYTESQVPKPPR